MGEVFPQPDGTYYLSTIDDLSGKTINYNFTLVDNTILSKTATKEWNAETGVKKLVEGQVLSTLNTTDLLVRVAPAALDASQYSFKLVNSQMGEAPITLGTPTAFTGLLTRASSSESGLWTISTSANEGETYKNANEYISNFQTLTYGRRIAFALQEAEGFTTAYELYFQYDNTIGLNANVMKLNDKYVANQPIEIPVGQVQTFTFDEPGNVYDAHLDIADATILRWGITDINGVSFKVGKLADEITTTTFDVTVHYVTLNGEVKTDVITVKPTQTLADVTTLASQNIEIQPYDAKNNKNTKTYDLAPMFEALGTNGTTLWKADVETVSEATYQVSAQTGKATKISDAIKYSFDKSTLKDITKVTIDANVAAQTAYSLTDSYYKELTFKGKGKVLNVVRVPFTLSIPALSNFLVKEQVVFGGTSNGKAYMNIEDQKAPYTNDGISRYAFHHAFNKFDNVFANNSTITFAIDPTQKIGNTAVTTYAKLINTTTKDVAIELVDNAKAYHTPIQIVISEAKYLGIYKYSDEELAANAFTLDVMSPIEQGNVVAANAAGVSVVATADGTALVKESDFKATTYANVAYKVFMDAGFGTDGVATEYSSEYIDNVAFASANANVFKVVDENGDVTTEGFPATKDDKGVNEGYIIVKPANAGYEATENVNITVTDIWGYSKKAAVSVTVKPSTAE